MTSAHRHGKSGHIDPAGTVDKDIAGLASEHHEDIASINTEFSEMEKRLQALEAQAHTHEPDPPPGPTGATGSTGPNPPETPVRVIPAGSHGNILVNVPGLWLFEPGALVKGEISLAARDIRVRGFRTDSTQIHETPIQVRKGSSGILEDGLIEHIGTPRNGMGYSSISANDGNQGTGWAGPWTFQRITQDQKDNGHYGTEVWGIEGLIIQDMIFKGKGGRVSPTDPTKRAENGHISTPRCNGAIYRRNTFDMTQGAWRVIEAIEGNDAQFIENTILGSGSTRGDTVPMNGGSTNQMKRWLVARNRVRDMKLFMELAGEGHTVIDNRLTNVAIERTGSAANLTWERNGPTFGPSW